MTLATDNTKKQYDGNGGTTVFAYDFKINADTDLVVVLTDANGSDTTLTLTTHYTVSGAGEESGGNVTMITAPATGESLTIYRSTEQTQDTDLENQGAYYAQTIEDMVDKNTMMIQELQEQLNRATLVPVTSDDAEEALTETTGDARYLKLSGGTMTGDTSLWSHVITTDVMSPGATDLISRPSADARYLKLSGGVITGIVTIDSSSRIQKGENSPYPDAYARQGYVDYYTGVSEGHLSGSTNTVQVLASGAYQDVISVTHQIQSDLTSIDIMISIDAYVRAPCSTAIYVYTKVVDDGGNTPIAGFGTKTQASTSDPSYGYDHIKIRRTETFTVNTTASRIYTMQIYCTDYLGSNLTGYVFSPTIVIRQVG